MEGVRALRLHRKRINLLVNRIPVLQDAVQACVSTFPPNTPLPNIADIFQLPIVLSLINSEGLDSEFTVEKLGPFIKAFPNIARQWKLEKDAQLVELIKSACGGSYTFNPDTVLGLATTMFSCKFCSNDSDMGYCILPMWHPRILIHSDALSACPAEPNDDMQAIHSLTKSGPWNTGNIFTFLTDDRAIMAKVLQEFGLDPDTTTSEQMDALDPIFECVSCNDPRKGRYTMKWIHLVRNLFCSAYLTVVTYLFLSPLGTPYLRVSYPYHETL